MCLAGRKDGGQRMVQRDHHIPLEAQSSLALKLAEPKVDKDNPWADDLLRREEIATRLTNLVATQEPPLSISLHGQWGTGKTFMLTRWQQALENEGYQAIYFNAWEDDFCDQPLLAIVGQLWNYFQDAGLKAMAGRLAEIALPLIEENLLSMTKASTGITARVSRPPKGKRFLLDAYLNQRNEKHVLRAELTKLSARIARTTNHPLVFIVDELDRCRPTFAIELLERVKHMFDVPHLVFVFGLNRDELCKSLSSVYGDIESDVYLRRFFDFEFQLSEVDSQKFALHLIERFQIGQVFRKLSDASRRGEYISDYENFRSFVPILWSRLGLSLRDIDYGIRLLALLALNTALGARTHPFLLAVLIAMKFKNPESYGSLLTGDFRASNVMDYIETQSSQASNNREYNEALDHAEGFLYCADNTNRGLRVAGESALKELRLPLDSGTNSTWSVISRRAQAADQDQRDRIVSAVVDGQFLGVDGTSFSRLATLIDTCRVERRR